MKSERKDHVLTVRLPAALLAAAKAKAKAEGRTLSAVVVEMIRREVGNE